MSSAQRTWLYGNRVDVSGHTGYADSAYWAAAWYSLTDNSAGTETTIDLYGNVWFQEWTGWSSSYLYIWDQYWVNGSSLSPGSGYRNGWINQNSDYGHYPWTYKKGHSAQNKSATIWAEVGGARSTVTVEFTIPALASYTVSYNANGGSGAPGAQTKWHGENLTLSSTKPTRTGYAFKGWATSSGGAVAYASGGTYKANAGVTLYAVWEAQASVLNAISSTAIGSNPVLTWTPYSSAATFAVTFSMGTWSQTVSGISPGSTSQYTLRTFTIPMTVCNQLPNATSGTMKAVLTTYISGTAVGRSERTFTVTVPSSVVPDFTYALSDDGQNILDLWIQNKSIIQAVVSTTGSYGSTVNSAELRVDGQYVVGAVTNNSASLLSSVLQGNGAMTVTIIVKDSRNRTATKTETITVYEYHVPEVTDISIALEAPDVDVAFNTVISSINGQNAKYIQVDRVRAYDQERTTVIAREVLSSYSQSLTLEDSVSDIETRNYSYEFLIEDAFGVVTYERQVRPGAGDRFGSLNADEYFVGIDESGFKDSVSGITGGVEDNIVTFNRTSGDTVRGIGFPLQLTPGTEYELIYSVNVISDETIVCVSFFDENYNYISTENEDYLIQPGDHFTTPSGTAWGLFLFGSAPSDYSLQNAAYREFSGISVREVGEPVQEEIEWMVETGNLGLDTPNQKYISRVQMRIEYNGTLRVGISYNNEDAFDLVHSSVSDHMRSITIPIKVKRCDHFRLRLNGVGQAKLYSMGYYTEDGSARCLI